MCWGTQKMGSPSSWSSKSKLGCGNWQEKWVYGCGSHSVGCEGHVLAAKSFTIVGPLETIVAEALAALHAVEFSWDLGLRRIILEGDVLQIVNAVKSTGRNWSKYGQLVEDTREVLNGMIMWYICHVRKDENSATRSLAKEAVQQITDFVWMEKIPIYICDIVLLEQLALSCWLWMKSLLLMRKKKLNLEFPKNTIAIYPL